MELRITDPIFTQAKPSHRKRRALDRSDSASAAICVLRRHEVRFADGCAYAEFAAACNFCAFHRRLRTSGSSGPCSPVAHKALTVAVKQALQTFGPSGTT
jgi:hypothetical protein